LGSHRKASLNLLSVARYLEHLNYRYDVRKKAYYVDGHEQEDVVKDRMKSVKRYLKDTLRCYEWVQVTKEQLQPLLDKAKKAKEEGKDKYLLSLKDAHVYSDKNGVEMYEFHVDASKDLLQFVRPENKKYGGNLSIRIPDGVKPLLRVGQDEALVHQYQQGRKCWHLSDGRKKIDPKTDGDGIMGSAFISRVFGFGMKSDEIDWEKASE
jgi:hypothetical protein